MNAFEHAASYLLGRSESGQPGGYGQRLPSGDRGPKAVHASTRVPAAR